MCGSWLSISASGRATATGGRLPFDACQRSGLTRSDHAAAADSTRSTTFITPHHTTSTLRDTLHELCLHFTLSIFKIISIVWNIAHNRSTTPSNPDSPSLIDLESQSQLSRFSGPSIPLRQSMATSCRVLPVDALPSPKGTSCAHPSQVNMPLR